MKHHDFIYAIRKDTYKYINVHIINYILYIQIIYNFVYI